MNQQLQSTGKVTVAENKVCFRFDGRAHMQQALAIVMPICYAPVLAEQGRQNKNDPFEESKHA